MLAALKLSGPVEFAGLQKGKGVALDQTQEGTPSREFFPKGGGMPPSTKGLKLLTRTMPLSDQEWLDLIEARRELIKPHLDTFTLKTLGEVKCLRSDNYCHKIGFNSPEVASGEFNLSTQGIFRSNYRNRVLDQRKYRNPSSYQDEFHTFGGTLYIWGLTRKVQWVIASVTYVCESGYKGRGYERATKVEIKETMILKILSVCKVSYEEIWRELSKEIHLWNQDRARLHEISTNLCRMCEIEELALPLVPAEESSSVPI